MRGARCGLEGSTIWFDPTGMRGPAVGTPKRNLSLGLIWWKMDDGGSDGSCNASVSASVGVRLDSLILLGSSHTLSPDSECVISACVCLCLHEGPSTVRQQRVFHLRRHRNHSIFSHVRESRLEMASWHRYARSLHIYS